MLEQLEEQLNGQKVILDTSGIVRPKKDILEFLCIGIGGLSNVDVEDFEEQISIFKQTRNLIENKGYYTIIPKNLLRFLFSFILKLFLFFV
jgi:hypothetical protein